jgi:oligoribonuclease (3'-5' exoribonuclease)
MNDLIFLDTETTGLEYDKHEIWEMAVAVNDGPVTTHIVVHSLKTADPVALDMNGYFRRHPTGARSEGPMVDLELREVLKGHTIVCANPTFDRIMMWMRWREEPYHYRSIDVESMALAVLGYDRPRGLKTIFEDLREMGYSITAPDHTAYNDVVSLRECYNALRSEQKKLRESYSRLVY